MVKKVGSAKRRRGSKSSLTETPVWTRYVGQTTTPIETSIGEARLFSSESMTLQGNLSPEPGWIGKMLQWGARLLHWFTFKRWLTFEEIARKDQDKLFVGERHGSRSVAVAFQHFMFLSRPGAVFDADLENEVETRLIQLLNDRLSGQYDPSEDFHLRWYQDHSLENRKVLLYFGPTVYVPSRGESPVGSLDVEVITSGGTRLTSPIMPDGKLAAVYSGQKEIGFSISKTAYPVRLNLTNTDVYDCFVRVRAAAGNLRSEGFVADVYSTGTKSLQPFFKKAPVRKVDFDQVWEVVLHGNPEDLQDANSLVMRLCLDKRVSRFHYESTGLGAAMAVNEITFSLDDFETSPERIWLDFDDRGLLRVSAMQPLSNALMWDFSSGRASRYNFTKFRSGDLSSHPVELIGQPNSGVVYRRRDRRPLGFFRRDATKLPIGFTQEDSGGAIFDLGWLNEAGTVDFGKKRSELDEAEAVSRDIERIGIARALSGARNLKNAPNEPAPYPAQGSRSEIKLGPFRLSYPDEVSET